MAGEGGAINVSDALQDFMNQEDETVQFNEKTQESNILLYAFMLAYLLAMGAVAVVAYRKKQAAMQASEDLQAHFGGNFNPVLLALTTFSSVFSGYTVMGVPQEASTKGFFALRWMPAILAIVAGMIVYYPRIRRLSEVRRYASPCDFITDRYRSKTMTCLGSFCACFPQLLYLTVQVVSFAETLRGITYMLVPKWAGMLLFSVVILTMETLGGMNAVVLSDAVQAALMIVGFVLLLCSLTYYYGTLDDIGPADCGSLGYVSIASIESLKAAGRKFAEPALCPAEDAGSEGCLPFGCVAAAKPEWVDNLNASQLYAFFWFVLNMMAFPLNPHMIQRVYVAASDGAVKMVMLVLAMTPFLTMMPGIVAGVVKGTFEASWSYDNVQSSAFAAVGNELRSKGLMEYILISMLTCSGLAAIMSTADSVILGVSNTLSIDIFKGILRPSASDQTVVRFGEGVSVIMTIVAVLLGLCVTSAEFGKLLTVQNGILMQILPAFLLGLYTDVSTPAVLAGVSAGLFSALFALAVYDPVKQLEIPAPDFGAMVNFVVLGTVHFMPKRLTSRDSPATFGDQFGDPLSAKLMNDAMSDIREPSCVLFALFGTICLLTVPVWGFLLEEKLVWGFPLWGLVVVVLVAIATLLALGAISTWRPRESAWAGLDDYARAVKRLFTGPEESEETSGSGSEDSDGDSVE